MCEGAGFDLEVEGPAIAAATIPPGTPYAVRTSGPHHLTTRRSAGAEHPVAPDRRVVRDLRSVQGSSRQRGRDLQAPLAVVPRVRVTGSGRVDCEAGVVEGDRNIFRRVVSAVDTVRDIGGVGQRLEAGAEPVGTYSEVCSSLLSSKLVQVR